MRFKDLPEDNVFFTLAAGPGVYIFTGLVIIGLGASLGVQKVRNLFGKKKK